MNDLNAGKVLFPTFSEASNVASKMRRNTESPLTVYKVGEKWAVGGTHMRNINQRKTIKSFDEIKLLLDPFKRSGDDLSVDEYISDIELESINNQSVGNGFGDDFILINVSIRCGNEIGMSKSNFNSYLVLEVANAKSSHLIKMGGKFARHIPLIKRQAESLINHPIIWHTWNNSSSSWGSNDWFYRIEKSPIDKI
jgi:hypothetical protein